MTTVVVAGGGPVGLAAAIEARRAGLGAVVVEPRTGVIDKACGEGLMPGALPLLHRLGVDPPGVPLLGVTYLDDRRRVDHRFRAGIGRGVRRTALHAALLDQAAAAGVERVTGRVTAVRTRPGAEGVEVVVDARGALPDDATPRGTPPDPPGSARASDAGARELTLHADWLLAADGLHSTVRRLLGLERRAPGRRRFGLRRHYPIAAWSDRVEVHWTGSAEVYVTPVAPDLVGFAQLAAAGTEFDATIASIPALRDRVAGVEPVTPLRGAGPFRQRAVVRAGPVLLIGDASGYVDALTGEGLRVGFEQARLAVDAIVAGRPDSYPRQWAEATRDFRVLTSGLVRAAGSPLRGAIVPVARAAPWAFAAAVERLAR